MYRHKARLLLILMCVLLIIKHYKTILVSDKFKIR